jgi:hypothetical protein
MNQRGRLAEFLIRGLALALGLVIFVALLAFSLVLFAVVLTAALLLFAYVWWKARRIRAGGAGVPVPGDRRPLRRRDLE